MRAEAAGGNVALILDGGERLEMLPSDALKLVASARLRDEIRFAVNRARMAAEQPAPVDGAQAIDEITGPRQAAETPR